MMIKDRCRNGVPGLFEVAGVNRDARQKLKQLTTKGPEIDGGDDTNSGGVEGVEDFHCISESQCIHI